MRAFVGRATGALASARWVRRFALPAVLLGVGWHAWSAQVETPGTPRVREYARHLKAVCGHSPGESPAVDAEAVRLMELAIADLRRCVPLGMRKRAGRFLRLRRAYGLAAEQSAGRDALASEFQAVDLAVASHGRYRAIAANCGSVSRLAVFDEGTGKRLAVPVELVWQKGEPAPFPGTGKPPAGPPGAWHQSLAFAPDGTLVVTSEVVRDAGMESAFCVVLLRVGAGRCHLTETLRCLGTLDFFDAVLFWSRLRVRSLDAPSTYVPPARLPQFRRVREFEVSGGRLRLVSDERLDQPLRFADAWVASARAARSPDRLQARCRELLPPDAPYSALVENPMGAGRVAVCFRDVDEQATLARLSLRWHDGGYHVEGIERK